MRLRVGRWTLEVAARALWLTQAPHPRCPDCQGRGAWWADAGPGYAPEPEICDCWRPSRRIPRPRPRAYRDEPPF